MVWCWVALAWCTAGQSLAVSCSETWQWQAERRSGLELTALLLVGLYPGAHQQVGENV